MQKQGWLDWRRRSYPKPEVVSRQVVCADIFHNRQRPPSTLGYVSLARFESQMEDSGDVPPPKRMMLWGKRNMLNENRSFRDRSVSSKRLKDHESLRKTRLGSGLFAYSSVAVLSWELLAFALWRSSSRSVFFPAEPQPLAKRTIATAIRTAEYLIS